MNKQRTFVIVLSLSLIVTAAPLFAQGKAPSASKGPQAGAGANKNAQTPGNSGKGDSQGKSAEQHPAGTHEQTTFASKLESNDKLAARLKLMLPPNTSISDAASGFKNQGQFISALHTSQNLNIPFDQLKAKMTGADAMPLGSALHALRPDLPQDQMKKEVKKAEAQTKTTLSTGTNAKAATTKK